jgi:hypothetical protein
VREMSRDRTADMATTIHAVSMMTEPISISGT